MSTVEGKRVERDPASTEIGFPGSDTISMDEKERYTVS